MKEEAKKVNMEQQNVKISVENNTILEQVPAQKVIEAFKKLKEQQAK